MTAHLLELPDECICTILSFLWPSQVRCVALTFNKRLFTISKPLLEPLNKIYRDETYFEWLFGDIKPDYGEALTKVNIEKKLNLTESMEISVPPRPSHHLEYLDLRDDLSWFENIVKDDPTEFEDNAHVYNDEKPETLERMIELTTRLGLTLPPAFVKLLRNPHLTDKLPTGMAWYIELSDLYKIRIHPHSDPERSVDGYMFTWFCDQQGCYYNNLYLDKEGRHAVLGSSFQVFSVKENSDDPDSEEDEKDLPDLDDDDRREDILECPAFIAGDQILYDVDFERWLIGHYYGQRLWFGVRPDKPEHGTESEDGKGEVIDHIKRYFVNVFTEEGRRMQ